jgi:transcription elongation factor Elf1
MAPKAKMMITWNGTDRDEGLRGQLLTDSVDNQALYDSMNGWKKDIQYGKAGAPQSQWATGRACPNCSGTLMMREMSLQGGVGVLFCKYCGKTYFQTDIETQNATTDTIYRKIPDDLMARYMKANEARLIASGELPQDTVEDSTIFNNYSSGVKSTMPLNGPLNGV